MYGVTNVKIRHNGGNAGGAVVVMCPATAVVTVTATVAGERWAGAECQVGTSGAFVFRTRGGGRGLGTGVVPPAGRGVVLQLA